MNNGEFIRNVIFVKNNSGDDFVFYTSRDLKNNCSDLHLQMGEPEFIARFSSH
jgi:hypothetical protein